jgi:hypothetical protein
MKKNANKSDKIYKFIFFIDIDCAATVVCLQDEFMKNSGSVQNVLKLSSAGIELSLTVALFLYGGYRLDQWLGLLPLFTIAGAFLGMAIGFYRLYRIVTADEHRDDNPGKR